MKDWLIYALFGISILAGIGSLVGHPAQLFGWF
ncbi:hypothetical protein ABID21_000639 [Pseudorhizobium tarimense]|uniref:Uncharacterized protein n=1 Tax=Pseudorhizobium tarimense TaxID=1079109 RepID=A0ABV2H253_9HYPH